MMRKIALILLILCFATQYTDAQSKKLHVSKHGGTKKLLTFGKIGYNIYHFTSSFNNCDTLICSGSGYEICKIDKNIIRANTEGSPQYKAYNKAIRATQKRIKKTKTTDGSFSLAVSGQNLSIKYYNADTKGNADIEIFIL